MLNKVTWSLDSINRRRKKINTNPDYQRPAVWTKGQKQLLIDSILRDYDIPKIYLHTTDEINFDVVDGQQRIRAIWSFFDDDFPLPKDADKVKGIDVANKKFSELDEDIKDIIGGYNLDIVILNNSNEDEIREMFLRLQNGTSLKAQEKRNAIPGKMRDFVKSVSAHVFFDKKVNFKDSRFTYDLVAAQMTLLSLTGTICTVKDKNLNEMYWERQDFDKNSNQAKNIFRILNYLDYMFEEKSPELTRYSVISLFILLMDLMPNYDIRGREKDLYNWFIRFESNRNLDKQKEPEKQNPILIKYQGWISQGSDTSESLEFRHKVLKEDLLTNVSDLPLKDANRNFDEAQRQVIYRKDNGTCKICGKKCEWNEWEADHIIPWSKGGKTSIENGQVLCVSCNSRKSDNLL